MDGDGVDRGHDAGDRRRLLDPGVRSLSRRDAHRRSSRPESGPGASRRERGLGDAGRWERPAPADRQRRPGVGSPGIAGRLARPLPGPARTSGSRSTTTATSFWCRPAAARPGSWRPTCPTSSATPAWSVDGGAVFAVVNMGVHSELFRVDAATGEADRLTDGRHSIGSWAIAASADRHVFTLREPDNPGDVWLMGTGADPTPTRVTRVFDYLSDDFRLPRQERARVDRRTDGVAVEGLLFYPLDYEDRAAVSAGHPDARGAPGVRQVRLRSVPQLRPGARRRSATSCCSPTIAEAPGTATRSCGTWWAATSRTLTWMCSRAPTT